jgi:site-specific DNA-methyltransferase (cytosine-N4-specific)
MLWLGMDQVMFKKNEIGSHRKYSNKGRNRATVETFKAEMSSIFSWLKSVLKQDRYACFIIGNSTINGEVVDNALLLSDVARENGFTEVACISRNIHSGKKSFNPSIGKIKTENILILQNTGKH